MVEALPYKQKCTKSRFVSLWNICRVFLRDCEGDGRLVDLWSPAVSGDGNSFLSGSALSLLVSLDILAKAVNASL